MIRPVETVMRVFFSFFAVAALSLAGCHSDAPSSGGSRQAPPAIAVPPSPTPSAAAPSPHAAASTSAIAATVTSLGDVRKETDRGCQPARAADNNMELKQQQGESAKCVERVMVRELDRVLLPLKTTSPARFHRLMDQQAAYNRFSSALSFLAEETMWVDFQGGTRSDGTARGTGSVGCSASTWLERVVYAKALAAGDATALAAEIRAMAPRGEKTKKALADIEGDSAKHTLLPPPDAGLGEVVLDTAAWKGLFGRAQLAAELSRTLAQSTCEDFPGLTAALGGDKACRDGVATYHLAACELEPMRGDAR